MKVVVYRRTLCLLLNKTRNSSSSLIILWIWTSRADGAVKHCSMATCNVNRTHQFSDDNYERDCIFILSTI